MKRGVAEILTAISKLKTKQERIDALSTWKDNEVLKTMLQLALHPDAKWLLPEGKPPYRPNNAHDCENILYAEARKMYLFMEGGNPNLNQAKRESLFINVLESVAAADAELICAAKDKKLPWKTITPEIVNAAFPGLLGNVTSTDANEQVS